MKHLLHGVALAVLTTTRPGRERRMRARRRLLRPHRPSPRRRSPPPTNLPRRRLAERPRHHRHRHPPRDQFAAHPLAISVVNPQALADRHVQSLYDFADGAVPSLRVATFEARQSALTVGIRGIVPLDANQPAREQGVGIYVDGVHLWPPARPQRGTVRRPADRGAEGPQALCSAATPRAARSTSSLRGRPASSAGASSADRGNFGSYNGEIHLNLPEFHNFRVKVDGVIQHQDATTRDPLAGSTGWNYYDRHGVRAEVEWRPVDHFSVDFAYDNGRDANTPFYSQLLNFNPNGCVAGTQAAVPNCALPGTAYTTLTGTVKPTLPGVVVNGTSRMDVADIGVPQQPSIDRTHGYTFHVTYNASPEIELRSITAWRAFRRAVGQ